MDNITHSLLGALVGTPFAARAGQSKHAILAASVLANNLPDADGLYASFLSQPLGYLLHHRGHTHTIAGAFGCGLLAWLIVRGFCSMRGISVSREANRAIAAVSVVGGLLHLALDSLNTYGVHPFWPIDNRWYYGDTIFIVEPLLWITLSLSAYFSAELGAFRKIFPAVILAGAGLIFFSGLVPPPVMALYGTLALLLGICHRMTSPSRRPALWILVSLSIAGLFSMSSRIALAMQRAQASQSYLLMSFIGPAPANPFCWSGLTIRKTAEAIAYQQRFFQPFEPYFPLDCARYSLFRTKENQEKQTVEWEMPLGIFQAISDNCRWKAFLRFARVPAPQISATGQTTATDVRFSRRGRNGFASVPLDGSCPDAIPPWVPPIDPGNFH